jgi:cyclase
MYIADFYCHELRIVVEVDGSIHNLKEVKEFDIIRENDIKSFGIKVIRLTNSEIRNNFEDVIKKLENIINEIKTNDCRKEE